jgi:hypothetical protein
MTDRPTHITTHNLRPERPERWWRRLCWAHPQIAVSGDLPDASADAAATASAWREAGITHIIDLRDEADTTFERNRISRSALTMTVATVPASGTSMGSRPPKRSSPTPRRGS